MKLPNNYYTSLNNPDLVKQLQDLHVPTISNETLDIDAWDYIFLIDTSHKDYIHLGEHGEYVLGGLSNVEGIGDNHIPVELTADQFLTLIEYVLAYDITIGIQLFETTGVNDDV